MTEFSRNLRTSIRMTVVVVFLLATTLTATVAIGLQYYFGQSMARQSASSVYAGAAGAIAARLANIGSANQNNIELLANNPHLAKIDDRQTQLGLFTSVLEKNPIYYGIYLGQADGSFFEVINLQNSDYASQILRAEPSDRWLVTTVRPADDGQTRTFEYLDKDLKIRVARSEPARYEVTSRPWYQSAIASETTTTTEPYLFAQLGVAGRTLARRVAGSDTVLGIDMTMSAISAFLAANAIASESDIDLFDTDGQVIASSHSAVTVPDKSMVSLAAEPDSHGQLRETRHAGQDWLLYVAPTSDSAVSGKPLFVGIRAPLVLVVGPALDKVKLSIAITTSLLLLFLPLCWLFANPIVRPIRQLAAQNDKVRRREYDQVERISSRVLELDDLSESMVTMVESIQKHELAQRRLMDSFIELIAQAIDDKSAYTGGHCARVPELALMLAERASASSLPAFKGFALSTEDEWREYRIAAWLHDCGKITTPEHIVDKGSKLETIYNRIHEVRIRFEVLWRDAELDYYKLLLKQPGQETDALNTLRERQETLQQDFQFVAACNVGGEYLGEEEQQRLRDIANNVWLRNFDNRIGLSPGEEIRLPANAPDLPTREYLLSDRPDHLIERTASTQYPAEFGINMQVPDHLSNLGEIYNLSVSRGTLTAEDRFRINEHMISTIKMLESLPFPPELAKVPRYASTHHETMRGSGYPRKLSGEQLSIPERILAVADIFEALTASDRPYKKAKPVSEALEIMRRMVLDEHIDRDCFELFVSEKVYLQYAEQFL